MYKKYFLYVIPFFVLGDRDAAELLISRGARVDRADAMGMLPIHFAAWSGAVEVKNKRLYVYLIYSPLLGSDHRDVDSTREAYGAEVDCGDRLRTSDPEDEALSTHPRAQGSDPITTRRLARIIHHSDRNDV